MPLILCGVNFFWTLGFFLVNVTPSVMLRNFRVRPIIYPNGDWMVTSLDLLDGGLGGSGGWVDDSEDGDWLDWRRLNCSGWEGERVEDITRASWILSG